MSRTATTLRRLSVPVLVATTLVAGSSLTALTGAAYATTSTVAISALSSNVNVGDPSTITVTTTNNQAVTIFASGSALFAADPLNNPAGAASISTTCPADSSPCPLPALTDTTSEAITVTATGADFKSATLKINVNGLHFANCPQTDVNSGKAATAAQLCSTQATAGTTKTATVAFVRNGTGVDAASLTFGIPQGSSAVFATTQPAGTAYVSNSQVDCTTAGGGLCKISYLDTMAPDNFSVVATGPNGIFATLSVDSLTSSTPGSLERTSRSVVVSPDGSTVQRPGVALQNTYTLRSTCTPTSATVTCQGDLLAGVPVALTVDHGFVTPNCTAFGTLIYANCTFAATPVAGAVVGNLKHLTGAQTYVTDINGQIVVTLGIARDAALDAAGYVDATVSGVAAGSSALLSEIAPIAKGSAAPTCTAATVNQPGCPSVTEWSTDNTPLNGGGVYLKPVDGSTLTGTPNNVLNTATPTYVMQTTDQFGNLSSSAGTSLTLAGTGTPDLVVCRDYSPSDACMNQVARWGRQTFDANNVATRTYTQFGSSFNNVIDSSGDTTQSRFAATLNPPQSNSSATSGTQTDVATWTAPVTTFAGFVASTTTAPARAGYDFSATSVQTATVAFNFYVPTAGNITFAVTPASSVPVNTVVTASATVLDQFGHALPGSSVQFFRSGDGTCSSAQSSGGSIATNDAGKAGFSFVCQTGGIQTVTMIVTDYSNNELNRGQVTITFVAPTPAPTATPAPVAPSIDGPAQRTVTLNKVTTLTGKGAANRTVYLHFHKAGTAANDYSIVRPVLVKDDGTWTRAFVSSCDYRVFVSNSDSVTENAASDLILAR